MCYLLCNVCNDGIKNENYTMEDVCEVMTNTLINSVIVERKGSKQLTSNPITKHDPEPVPSTHHPHDLPQYYLLTPFSVFKLTVFKKVSPAKFYMHSFFPIPGTHPARLAFLRFHYSNNARPVTVAVRSEAWVLAGWLLGS
jgi:hypothetical protein